MINPLIDHIPIIFALHSSEPSEGDPPSVPCSMGPLGPADLDSRDQELMRKERAKLPYQHNDPKIIEKMCIMCVNKTIMNIMITITIIKTILVCIYIYIYMYI